MEKAKVKIDSWEPVSEGPEFKYPKGKDPKDIERKLTPKLLKALREGLGDNLPDGD